MKTTKHLIIQTEKDFKSQQYKDKSASIEMKMIIDDGKVSGSFIRMFCLDDFREMDYSEIEETIEDTTAHIARSFSLVLLNRSDCLNGKFKSKGDLQDDKQDY